jgi:hypothetical protein
MSIEVLNFISVSVLLKKYPRNALVFGIRPRINVQWSNFFRRVFTLVLSKKKRGKHDSSLCVPAVLRSAI